MKALSHPSLVSTIHFLDLLLPQGRYKSKLLEKLTKEKYIITKKTHTSFLDLDEITPLERQMIIKFIMEDLKEQSLAIDRAKMAAKR